MAGPPEIGLRFTKIDYQSLGMSGLMIETVFPDSAAARAGLLAGDLLLRLDGKDVSSEKALHDLLAARAGPHRRDRPAAGEPADRGAPGGALIVLEQVDKRFREGSREHPVLAGLDLEIGRGELVVLLGRSGSGKSTLLNLVAGIELADRGQVLFDGVDLGSLGERERTLLRRERIGFVFQFFNLIPTLTVEENVFFPLELLGRRSAAEKAAAGALLDYVGLGDRRSSFPDALSGGEQQRVAIARALVVAAGAAAGRRADRQSRRRKCRPGARPPGGGGARAGRHPPDGHPFARGGAARRPGLRDGRRPPAG